MKFSTVYDKVTINSNVYNLSTIANCVKIFHLFHYSVSVHIFQSPKP